MKKTTPALFTILLIIALLALPVAAQTVIQTDPPPVVWVDAAFSSETPGWGVTHFANLHLAVGSVAPGGTVHVAAGSYGPVSIDTAGIEILGSFGVELDGQGVNEAQGIEVNVPGVTLANLTLRNWSEQTGTAAVRLQDGSTSGSHTTIRDCIFTDNNYAIWSFTGNNQILDNTVTNSAYHGMYFSSDENYLDGNEIRNSLHSAILIEGNSNTITGSTIIGNNEGNSGSWLGALTMIGNDNTLSENTVVDNERIGIYVLGNRNTIASNEASRNGITGGWRGIHLVGAHNQILYNDVQSNNSAGIEIEGSDIFPADQNLLQGNTVMNNRDSGLYIRAGTATVIANRIGQNGYSGIRIMGLAAGSLVRGNVCDSNGDYGIESRGGNQIIGNTVRYNQRADDEYFGGGIYASEGDVIRFNSIYGNSPYGLMTWLGASVDALSEPVPLDAQNNWWGHPDGPTLIDLKIPYNSLTADQGDAAAGFLATEPWLQTLSLSSEKTNLTAGQYETITVTLLNSDGEPAGNNNLSVHIIISGSPVVEETVILNNGQGTFTYRRPTPGTDTVTLALFVAGEPTGLTDEGTLEWIAGTTPPDDEAPIELPNTGLDMTLSLLGLLLMGLGTRLRRS